MESPPVAANTEGGVATMPSSELRHLIASSQGPRPLSSVFAYRATHGSLRYPQATVVRAAHFLSTAVDDRQDDERKPSPRQGASQEDEGDNDKNDEDNDIPALMERRAPETDSDSSSTRSSPADATPSTARTRSACKRRAEKMNNDNNNKSRKKTRVETNPTAANLKVDQDDMSDAGSCCICMCDPEVGERATIDGCDHAFCFDCIEKWGERENTCPLCKVRFTRINREGGRKKGQKGTKKVKQRDQRADLNPSSALEGLLAGLSGNGNSGFSSSIARLIFSGLGPTSGNVIDFGFNGAGSTRAREGVTRQVRWRNPPRAEDAFLSDNDDDASDDGSRGYSDFVNNMRRMHPPRGTVGVFATYPLFAPPPPPPPMLRSYATNAHEPDAGGTADTALEIEDDSDDEVEVVDVRASAGRDV